MNPLRQRLNPLGSKAARGVAQGLHEIGVVAGNGRVVGEIGGGQPGGQLTKGPGN